MIAAQQVDAQGPGILAVVMYALYYVGVVGVLGAATIRLVGLKPAVRPVVVVWAASFAGAGGIALLRLASVGDTTLFLGLGVGRAAVLRLAGLVLAYPLILAMMRGRSRLVPMLVLALGTVSVWGHLLSSHAAAGVPALEIPVQLVHVVAVSAWIGGLGFLWLNLRGDTDGPALRRFSALAGFAIVTVGLTGLARSWSELQGDPSALVATPYGRMVLFKTTAILGLAALGALNRYRFLPANDVSSIRRVAVWELGLAAAVIAVTAVLSQTQPGI